MLKSCVRQKLPGVGAILVGVERDVVSHAVLVMVLLDRVAIMWISTSTAQPPLGLRRGRYDAAAVGDDLLGAREAGADMFAAAILGGEEGLKSLESPFLRGCLAGIKKEMTIFSPFTGEVRLTVAALPAFDVIASMALSTSALKSMRNCKGRPSTRRASGRGYPPVHDNAGGEQAWRADFEHVAQDFVEI